MLKVMCKLCRWWFGRTGSDQI